MLSSGWGISHCCFDDPGEEECYWESQEYSDEIEKQKEEIADYFRFPETEHYDKSMING